MRVTVCFDQTRVIVPCKGGVTVQELSAEACRRYKRAIGKKPNYWVNVVQLENAIDGGILDPSDYVYDVAEDKDQLNAIFEEEGGSNASSNASSRIYNISDGSKSPLPYHEPVRLHGTNESYRGYHINTPSGKASIIRHSTAIESKHYGMEIDVGVDTLKSNTSITVRSTDDGMYSTHNGDLETYPHHIMNNTISTIHSHGNNHHHYYGKRESGNGEDSTSFKHQNTSKTEQISDNVPQSPPPGQFVRGGVRQSTMGVLANDAWDNLPDEFYQYEGAYTPHDVSRGQREPPEGRKMSDSPDEHFEIKLPKPLNSNMPSFYQDSQEIFVENDGTPWGLQVLDYNSEENSVNSPIFSGLLIVDIEKGSRADRDGQVQKGDVIIEINSYVLAQFDIDGAQDIFRNAMQHSSMQLRIYPVEERERKKEEKNYLSPHTSNHNITNDKTSPASSTDNLHSNTKLPLVAQSSINTLANNTKKIGKVMEIKLKRGTHGLGFSITTRDNPVGDPGPICIKNILPKGAAIQDGRLQAGDRLLKVNGTDMNGKTQEDAVSVLRAIQPGEMCTLFISRHVDMLPRKMKDDPITDQIVCDDTNKEDHMFEIALNDTGSAGLGISLKGNQSKRTGKDLGIFIKNIFSGGAAYQDGRLHANDQLVAVNGQQLLGMSNQDAIRLLRSSMSTVGNVRGMIQMVVRRRKAGVYSSSSPRYSSEASSEYSDSLTDRHKQAAEITEPIREEYEPHPPLRPDLIGQINPYTTNQIDVKIEKHNNLRITDSPYDNVPSEHGQFIESPDVPYDPFNRESIFRHSISEKRRGPGTSATDLTKSTKQNQLITTTSSANFGSTKALPQPLSPSTSKRRTDFTSPAKWVTPSAETLKSYNVSENALMCDSPLISPKNYNNSSNAYLPGTNAESISNSLDQSNHEKSCSSKTSEKTAPPSYSQSSHMIKSSMRKAISTESLISIGQSKLSVPPLNKLPQTARRSPYVKQTVLPMSDVSLFAACIRTSNIPSPERRKPVTAFLPPPKTTPQLPDVGPTLGMAKSSSLESLQMAIAKEKQTPKAVDPKIKGIRGRVLNDSFRQALSTTNDILPPSKGANKMEAVTEEGHVLRSDSHRSNQTSSSEESRKKQKSSKFFGLFKKNKSRRSASQERVLDGKLSEYESHRRLLEANKMNDYKKHKEESERIQAKAREMRLQEERRKMEANSRLTGVDRQTITTQKMLRSPSVPVTQMQRINIKDDYKSQPTGRKSVDPTSMAAHNDTGVSYKWVKSKQSPTQGRRGRETTRNGHSSKTEVPNNYNSLPRQRKFEANNPQISSPIRAANQRDKILNTPKTTSLTGNSQNKNSLYLSARPTPSKLSSSDFYNQQKPVPTSRKTTPSRNNLTTRPDSPSTTNRRLYYNDISNTKPSQNQNGQNNKAMENGRVTHREHARKSHSNNRHSVHVDLGVKSSLHTSADDAYQMLHSTSYNSNSLPRQHGNRKKTKSVPHRTIMENLRLENASDSDNSSHTNSSNSTGHADKNRKTLQKLMKTQYGRTLDVEKIQISQPYNL